MPVALQIDAKQMKKLERALGRIKDGVPKALAPAINRALATGQTTVKREIRQVYFIKAKDIPTAVHRATYSSMSGHIMVRQGMLDASKFYYKPLARQPNLKKTPLFVRIKKGGGGIIARGFVTDDKGPFQRRSSAPRYPIRKILTIGASIMASQPSVGPAVNKKMGETFAKRIDHEIKRVMASAGGHS